MQTVNPDIHDARKMLSIAAELSKWLEFEWSHLYGSSPDTIQEFRNQVSDEFSNIPVQLIRKSCPLFLKYMLEDCKMDVRLVDWKSLAIAVDNLNGMYHPLRLTKIVLREPDE